MVPEPSHLATPPAGPKVSRTSFHNLAILSALPLLPLAAHLYQAWPRPDPWLAATLLAQTAVIVGIALWDRYLQNDCRLALEQMQSHLNHRHRQLEEQYIRQAGELVEVYRNYEELVQSANSIILRWDTSGVILFMNPFGLDFFGYREEEIIGRNVMETIVPSTESTGRDLAYMIEDIAQNPDDYLHNENENVKADGTRVWIAWANKAVQDAEGRTTEILSIGSDITEKKRYEQQIFQLAHHDNLTGLPNRMLFMRRLEERIAEASKQEEVFALLYLDLDRFKPINDSLGHHSGDLLLESLARRLEACVFPGDTLARMGGDEFTMILCGCNDLHRVVERVQMVAGQLLGAVADPFNINGHRVFVSASIGIVLYPMDGREAAELLKNADTAMYQAKQQGKNRFLFYESHMNAWAAEHLKLETELRQALQRDQFSLVYQPIMHLGNGSVEAVECLLRWHHPRLGDVPPERFIPIAEEGGLIPAISEWTLSRAVAQAAQWHHQGMLGDILMTVNLSPLHFQDPQLVEIVAAALRRHELPPSRLGIEITESTLLAESGVSMRTARALDELGVRLLIDDFGTGYSSLARLHELPVHMLKIDRSFISGGNKRRSDHRLTGAIIALAHSLGIPLIAEGVENMAQLEFLTQQGCDYAQGYLLSRPCSRDELEERLRNPSPLTGTGQEGENRSLG